MIGFFDHINAAETPPYIIAEIGSNHNGDMTLAREMIAAAKDCGCDAVKFQSWTPTSLISKGEYDRNQKYNDSPKKHFGSLSEMVERYYLRTEQHHELREYCDRLGIHFCSSHFSPAEADLLVTLGVKFFKIASMDINNLELLRYTAAKGLPVVLSTGMATMAEIDQAVRVIEEQNNKQIVLLHCISLYPPDLGTVNLRNIPMLREAFGYPVGLSDHCIGESISVASVALGSRIIEKHFTIDRDLPGWDHEMSADPAEMKKLVDASKDVFTALGSSRRSVSPAEEQKKLKFRRSLVATRRLSMGSVLALGDLVAKRPGNGIPPDELSKVIGRTLRRSIDADDQVFWDDLK